MTKYSEIELRLALESLGNLANWLESTTIHGGAGVDQLDARARLNLIENAKRIQRAVERLDINAAVEARLASQMRDRWYVITTRDALPDTIPMLPGGLDVAVDGPWRQLVDAATHAQLKARRQSQQRGPGGKPYPIKHNTVVRYSPTEGNYTVEARHVSRTALDSTDSTPHSIPSTDSTEPK